MKDEGYDPKVLYGIFRPTTHRSTWDERWQRADTDEFVHFWLAFQRIYYDYSCFQFGATAPIKTDCNDPRYEVIGEYNCETGGLTTTGSYYVEWETLTEKDGVPVLKLVPIFI